MESLHNINFKLIVPPRVQPSQVNTVRPREKSEHSVNFTNMMQQIFTKTFDATKDCSIFPAKDMVKAVSPAEEIHHPIFTGDNYSSLFTEVEKVRLWKAKVESDNTELRQKHWDDQKTIDTQRQAIKEIQFSNERLSMKLEEKKREIEDFQNKDNATRDLCNILKDNFQWSASRMIEYESDRDETQSLLVENLAEIKKMTAEFDNLCAQAEADQQEIKKVKEALKQHEELKVKNEREKIKKDEEIAALQVKLANKNNELVKVMCDLEKNQNYCKGLQESTLAALEQNKKEYEQQIRNKDLNIQELTKIRTEQKGNLEQLSTSLQQMTALHDTAAQKAKDLDEKLMANKYALEKKILLIEQLQEEGGKKDAHVKILEEDLASKLNIIIQLTSESEHFKTKDEERATEIIKKECEIQKLKTEIHMADVEKTEMKKTCEDIINSKHKTEEKFVASESKVRELEQQLSVEMQKNKNHRAEIENLLKEKMDHEANYVKLTFNCNKIQSENMCMQQEFEEKCSSMKAVQAENKEYEEKVLKLEKEIAKLQEENQHSREEVSSMKMSIEGKSHETESLGRKIEEDCALIQEKVAEKEKRIKAAETKLSNLKKRLDARHKIHEEFKKENKILKKQLEKQKEKTASFEKHLDQLKDQCNSLKNDKDDNCEKIMKDLESKSSLAAELEQEMEKLKLKVAEAVKSRDDLEAQCQQKINDMLVLMDKNKTQYEKTVEQKDAELEGKKKSESEITGQAKTLEMKLLTQKKENDLLKSQAKAELAEKERLQKKVSDLTRELSSAKLCQMAKDKGNRTSEANHKERGHSDSHEVGHTPENTNGGFKTIPAYKERQKTSAVRDYTKIPGKKPNMFPGTSKIKSYRIRTPPSEENEHVGKSPFDLDAKSDSSDQYDLLNLANITASTVSSLSKPGLFKKLQSPIEIDSPGNSLKQAAIKRMRDAGWTTAVGHDRKKKRASDKIFG